MLDKGTDPITETVTGLRAEHIARATDQWLVKELLKKTTEARGQLVAQWVAAFVLELGKGTSTRLLRFLTRELTLIRWT